MSEYVPKQVNRDVAPPAVARERPATAALPGTAVRPQSARWMGSSTYAREYRGARGDRPDILRQYVPLAGAFDPRTTHKHDYAGEAGDWAPAPVALARPIPPAASAPFTGTTSYRDQYRRWEGAPAATFARPQSAAASAAFSGRTHTSSVHVEMHGERVGSYAPPISAPGGRDTRLWHTEHEEQYTRKDALADDVCPASRLPVPPPRPEAAPNAYERDALGQSHVLWDTSTGRWAVQ